MPPADGVRLATVADAADVGRMLHDFSVEYDDVTPGAEAFGRRIAQLVEQGHVTVLLAGHGPDGFSLFRFAPSLYSDLDECYLAELYVAPDHRGHGLGEALLAATLEHARRRADYIHLGTSDDDTAARGLYEKLGFRRTEGDDGPVMYVYEREL